jgi:hypothetical protein
LGESQTIIVVYYDAIEGIYYVFGTAQVAGAIWCWVEHQIGHIKSAVGVRWIWVSKISLEQSPTIIVVYYDAIEGIYNVFSTVYVAEAIWCWVEHQIGHINSAINVR